MKIYFAGAIRGGRKDVQLYEKLIAYLGEKGQVLTEHVGSLGIESIGEIFRKDEDIYNRDIKWLQSANIVVAEVTTPSLGVGYELGIAEKLNIPIFLYEESSSSIKRKNLANIRKGEYEGR